MSTYIKQIENKTGDIIYPQTKVSAIYDTNNMNLQTILDTKIQPVTSRITLLSNGWNNNKQTLTVSGVTATNSLLVTPAPASIQVWQESGVRCISQSANTLIFECIMIPETEINVNVLIF